MNDDRCSRNVVRRYGHEGRVKTGYPRELCLSWDIQSLLDHRDDLDLNHGFWLSETADLDRCAGRTGYPEITHAHVGALGHGLDRLPGAMNANADPNKSSRQSEHFRASGLGRHGER